MSNLDVFGYFEFGDVLAVPQFAMAHYFAHDAESNAIAAQYGQTIGTYNVDGQDIVWDWIGLMDGSVDHMTAAMYDWLEAHNDNHQAMLVVLGNQNISTVTGEVDLSLADFSDPTQLYDWLTLHIQLHQYEQAALGLS